MGEEKKRAMKAVSFSNSRFDISSRHSTSALSVSILFLQVIVFSSIGFSV